MHTIRPGPLRDNDLFTLSLETRFASVEDFEVAQSRKASVSKSGIFGQGSGRNHRLIAGTEPNGKREA